MSSRHVFMALLAMQTRWKNYRDAAGAPISGKEFAALPRYRPLKEDPH